MEIIKSTSNLNPQDIYRMTRGADIVKMSTMQGAVINVGAFIYYDDPRTDANTGAVQNRMILSIRDTEGNIYATNSNTFISEFLYITELFGENVNIKVVGGKTKSGRNFITCTI